VEAVIHLAAKVGLGVDVNDLPDYASSNDAGTAVLLAGMARKAVLAADTGQFHGGLR
jgi:dTDP-L-rhamnose 4-epimerase